MIHVLPTLLVLLLGVSMLPAPALGARGEADSGRMVLEKFRTRGVTDDQHTQWELSGGNAVVEGPLVQLDDIELVFHSAKGDKVIVTSPHCAFNRVTQIGASDAPLRVRNQMVTVDGVGYDILAGQQQLHIRDKARMWIKEQKGVLDGVLPPGLHQKEGSAGATASPEKKSE